MAPPPPRSLPSDVLLHVLLRLDPRSIVRCAAVSKHWRRAVIDNAPQVRRHPSRQADRRLLLGFHYREIYPGMLRFCARSTWSPSAGHHWSDDLPVPSFVPAGSDDKPEERYAQLACSDGLVLVCRGILEEISVYNPMTGFHASMPRLDQLVPTRYILHTVHGVEPSPTPNSFQVLAMEGEPDGVLALQNYCSMTGLWSPIIRPIADELRMPHMFMHRITPVVCQGAIHFLCIKESENSSGIFKIIIEITHTVAVDIGTGRAWMTRLPKECTMINLDICTKKMLILATEEDGRLALLRREDASMKVSIWVYTGCDSGGSDDSEVSWVLLRSFDVRKLIEDAGLAHFRLECKDWVELEVRLEWFCPRSRCLIIWVPYLGLFVLDLESMQIQRAAGDNQTHVWPYEIDLTLLFSSLKQFY
ncbi:hypothetical protein E2562_001371 [Oryza meyeriana var. granulata]|uniref:F-box domain-containing protein n=1 Tax=Oryza meyeriana var. granulata TaxID=110450 RepID=A0A6G1DCF7_9ORYZ|nr:hypothetical protein E2562_001371 [Oryza meyeriana var. granulata]